MVAMLMASLRERKNGKIEIWGVCERERERWTPDFLFLEILDRVSNWLDWDCWLSYLINNLERHCTFVLLHGNKNRSVREGKNCFLIISLCVQNYTSPPSYSSASQYPSRSAPPPPHLHQFLFSI